MSRGGMQEQRMHGQAPVTIYTLSGCGHCHRARHLLRSRGIEFSEVSGDGDREFRRRLLRQTGGATVPQVAGSKRPSAPRSARRGTVARHTPIAVARDEGVAGLPSRAVPREQAAPERPAQRSTEPQAATPTAEPKPEPKPNSTGTPKPKPTGTPKPEPPIAKPKPPTAKPAPTAEPAPAPPEPQLPPTSPPESQPPTSTPPTTSEPPTDALPDEPTDRPGQDGSHGEGKGKEKDKGEGGGH